MYTALRTLAAAAAAAMAAGGALVQEPARITSFTPQGQVTSARQVRAEFSAPMVPFGDPLFLMEPFEMDCSAPGSGRWVDPRNWVYEFENDLGSGMRCSFRLKDGVTTLDGAPLAGQTRFSFDTGGPVIVRSNPWEGHSSISEDQAFVLDLNGPAREDSILRNVHFVVEGIGEQVGVRLVTGDLRRSILKTQYQYRNQDDPPNVVVLRARQNFPNDTDVRLVWGRMVASPSGVVSNQDQTLVFHSRRELTAEFHCLRENFEEPCVPLGDLRLDFSSFIPKDSIEQITLRDASGKSYAAVKHEDDALINSTVFQGPFPRRTEFVLDIPSALRDDSGRPLANAAEFPLRVRTGDYPPLAKFAADFGILERNADPVLPVTVRNLEAMVPGRALHLDPPKLDGRMLRVGPGEVQDLIRWMSRLYEPEFDSRERSTFSAGDPVSGFQLPKPNGSEAFEVVGIPLPAPGLYIVELESRILGDALLDPSAPMYVRTGALVTNLAVHLKIGRESSLVWVTRLDDAQPVSNAEVSLWNCRGESLFSGSTNQIGIARIDGALPELPYCNDQRGFYQGTMAVAQKEDDLSFAFSNWDEGIEPWRFQIPFAYWRSDPFRAHSVIDRTLLRAGETVHMKHIVRMATGSGFELPGPEDWPKGLVIRHAGSDEKYRFPVEWDADGTALTDWDIPREAKLGTYLIALTQNSGEDEGSLWHCGSFRVEEFRVPLSTADLIPPKENLIAPEKADIDAQVRYLSGGGASNLPVIFRHRFLLRGGPSFEDFDGFTFGNGGVTPGVQGSTPQGPTFPTAVASQNLTLDATGGRRVTIADFPSADQPISIQAELEFRDPNGEVQTVASSIPVYNASRFVGIKPESWALSEDKLSFDAAVVDLKGTAVAGVPVNVELFHRKVYSARKRLVGGFYSYEHHVENIPFGVVCQGMTDAKGRLHCESKPPLTGYVLLQAETRDPRGRRVLANTGVQIASKDEWWFEAENHDRIDVLPEQSRYEPGDTARFQVRVPFAQSTALVTVEREGILEAFVQPLQSGRPLVEVPVDGSYSPNVFVSVLCVRGRVGDVQPTAMIDLGKPTFRLGIAQIQVGWKAHELKVKVEADRDVYRVRETAEVEIAVEHPDGTPARGVQLAVAAVDKGLLELSPNYSWNLLQSMMRQRPSEVRTATAQMQVVGKRHYGMKAFPQGGGGGQGPTRELFDTLLFWAGRVRLDNNGKARVRIPLNDSLTSFRIAAVANDHAQRFGTGETDIRTTQDIMLFGGISPLVREGDSIFAEFTVRNASDRDLRASVRGSVSPLGDLESKQVVIPAGQAKIVGWDLEIPTGAESLRYEVAADAGDGRTDRLALDQAVVPAVPVRAFQATLFQLDADQKLPIQIPQTALPGRGGLDVSVSSSLVSSLDPVRDWARDYRYNCLEQMVSKAVILRDRGKFDEVMSRLPAYLDSDGLARYFPGPWHGSEVLTSYLLAISKEAGWTVPDNPRARMINGLQGFVEGRIIRYSDLPTADLSIRKLMAVEALSRYDSASWGLLSSVRIEPNLWPTSAVLDYWNILRRLKDAPERTQRLAAAENVVRSRLDFQGTAMSFSDDRSANLWWLMRTADESSLRLVGSTLDQPSWRDEMPRLVKGALERRVRGHWMTTTANAWGVVTLQRFVEAFEAQPVSGITTASVQDAVKQLTWAIGVRQGALGFDWPKGPSQLDLRHRGSGAPWVSVLSRAAIPLTKPIASGYRIVKSWQPVQRARSDAWTVGDVVRVRLEINAQADRTWVVIDDPIPSGAGVLGSGLGRDSRMLNRRSAGGGTAWPTFVERRFEGYRAYFRYLPKGDWAVEYTVRLNQSGDFGLPPTRVEALYSPEVFGEIPNADVHIERPR